MLKSFRLPWRRPSLQDHMIALAAGFDVLGEQCRQLADVVTIFARTLRREIAQEVRLLPRARRRDYWALRLTGMYPLDALEELEEIP